MLILCVLILAVALLLAFANGANDNSKGVATLIGSGLLKQKHAIYYAAVATLLGSIAAIWFGAQLADKFKGSGMVSQAVLLSPAFPACVGIAAALTVLLATRIAMPISTTHAMVGSIIGVGISSQSIIWQSIWTKFFYPLLASPFIAVLVAMVVYSLFRWVRIKMGISSQTCLCVEKKYLPVRVGVDGSYAMEATGLKLATGDVASCTQRYGGRIAGIDAQHVLDRSHLLTAGMVSFARGLNDTPKVAALLIGLSFLDQRLSVLMIGLAIVLGGLLAVRRVAKTMSHRITAMNDGQAFTANLVTAFMVIVASKWGVPVSTTHVSCGSLFGIGAVNRQAHGKVIGQILLAWVTTLPVAAALGWVAWQAWSMMQST